ncbi:MAG: rhomboid family intramembrane serine protease [Akkermansiaceae bacterium]|nr:rhomboid family intramembrane serine protease [Akkermansiaceae bacterium]
MLRRHALVLLLIASMALIHTLQYGVSLEFQTRFMAVPADVVEAWQLLRSGEADLASLWPFATLVTYAFLHAGLDHLAGNMLLFWVFGALIHQLLGWRWLLLIVGVTAAGAGITHTVMNPESLGTLLGFSGVVYGVMGAYLGLSVRWQLPDPHVWPIARPVPPIRLVILAAAYVAIDYFAIFGGTLGETAYGAHVGGFTCGLFLTSFITPRPAQALAKR